MDKEESKCSLVDHSDVFPQPVNCEAGMGVLRVDSAEGLRHQAAFCGQYLIRYEIAKSTKHDGLADGMFMRKGKRL